MTNVIKDDGTWINSFNKKHFSSDNGEDIDEQREIRESSLE